MITLYSRLLAELSGFEISYWPDLAHRSPQNHAIRPRPRSPLYSYPPPVLPTYRPQPAHPSQARRYIHEAFRLARLHLSHRLACRLLSFTHRKQGLRGLYPVRSRACYGMCSWCDSIDGRDGIYERNTGGEAIEGRKAVRNRCGNEWD